MFDRNYTAFVVLRFACTTLVRETVRGIVSSSSGGLLVE